MKVLDILIFGSPSPARNYYELELLRRHLEVMSCATVAEAVSVIENYRIKMVAMVGNSLDSTRSELLRLTQLRYAVVPVFFLPESIPDPNIVGEANDADATQIIPELVQLLKHDYRNVPATALEPARKARSNVALKRTDYPLKHAEAIAAFEAEWVGEILKRFHGNISLAAREMGMARRSLQLRIRNYQIDVTKIRKAMDEETS